MRMNDSVLSTDPVPANFKGILDLSIAKRKEFPLFSPPQQLFKRDVIKLPTFKSFEKHGGDDDSIEIPTEISTGRRHHVPHESKEIANKRQVKSIFSKK